VSSFLAIFVAMVVMRVVFGGSDTARGLREPPGWVAAVVIMWLLGLISLVGAIATSAEGAHWAWPVVLWSGAVYLLTPWLLARCVAIPLGLPRLAWVLGRVAHFSWRGRVRSGAVVAACLAIRRPPSDRLLGWLERRLSPDQMGGAGALALGFLAAHRGDGEAARDLLRGARFYDRAVTPRLASRLLCSWGVAEAAQRGDWRRVLTLARRPGPRTRRVRRLGRVAAALSGLPDAGRFSVSARLQLDLLVTWRPAERRLLRRALRGLDAGPTAQVEPAAPGWVARAQAWDHQLGALQASEQWAARAAALGVAQPETAVEALREEVVRDLAVEARAAPLPQGERLTEVALEVLDRLAEERFEPLEQACAALRDRVGRGERVPMEAELREWAQIRRLYERAAALGPGHQRSAMHVAHGAVCDQAVWLYNHHDVRRTANAMMRWLLEIAIAGAAADLIDLQQRNLNCRV
jgi:hypothetical protein